jgi:septum formation protein
MKIILASRSPQRQEILGRLGVEFEVAVPEVDEVREGDPEAAAVESALRKAHGVTAAGALVIGCDTEVVLDGGILGKPGGEAQARDYLERLSGRSHQVLSGLALVGPEPEQQRQGVATSVVTFRELASEEVERYLRSGEWRERAGGYAIQGLGSTLVTRVDGDISNVVGLPVSLLLDLAPELLQDPSTPRS